MYIDIHMESEKRRNEKLRSIDFLSNPENILDAKYESNNTIIVHVKNYSN